MRVAVDAEHAIHRAREEVEVVGDKQDRTSGFLSEDQPFETYGGLAVDIRRGLVKNEQRRIRDESPRE